MGIANNQNRSNIDTPRNAVCGDTHWRKYGTSISMDILRLRKV